MVPTQSSMPMRAPKLQRSGTAPASTEATNFAISDVSAGMGGSFAAQGANYATSQALTARVGEK
jgi:hypothetical protein